MKMLESQGRSKINIKLNIMLLLSDFKYVAGP